MASQSIAHNHHYVPQFLIRNFVDRSGKVWVYDTEDRVFAARSPKRAASQLDFYAWTKEDGSTDYQTIEDYFSRVVENGAAVAIQRLLRRELLDAPAIMSFFRFVAAQLCRTPAFFNRTQEAMAPVIQEMFDRMVNHDAGFRERVAANLAGIGTSPDEINRLFDSLSGGGAEVKPAREFVMQQSLALIEAIADDFSRMKWCFFEVPAGDPDLVIADHPVFLHDADPSSYGRRPFGIRSAHVEITLPLSPRMLACARWDGPCSYGQLEPGAVEVANDRTLRSAHRYVLASHRSDDLLQRAVAARVNAPRMHLHRLGEGERLIIATAFY